MSDKQVAPPGMDWSTTFGLLVCGGAVAAFSGWSQFETARMAGYPTELAWVLPVATDAVALFATQTWLASPARSGLRRYSATLSLLCMALSCAMAAVHAITDNLPTWAHGAIHGLPGAVLAAIIHLGVMRLAYVRSLSAIPAPVETVAPPITEDIPESTQPESTDTAPTPPTPPAAEEIVVSSPITDAPVMTPDPPATASHVAVEEAGASVVTLPRRGSKKAQMLAYLNEHGVLNERGVFLPSGDQVTGKWLDVEFGASSLGRVVLREWQARQDAAEPAVGE